MRLANYQSGLHIAPALVLTDNHLLDVKASSAAAVPATLLNIVSSGPQVLWTRQSLARNADGLVLAHCPALLDAPHLTPSQNLTKNVFCIGNNYRVHVAKEVSRGNRWSSAQSGEKVEGFAAVH